MTNRKSSQEKKLRQDKLNTSENIKNYKPINILSCWSYPERLKTAELLWSKDNITVAFHNNATNWSEKWNDDEPGLSMISFQWAPARTLSSSVCTIGMSDQMRTVESRELDANTNGRSGCDVRPTSYNVYLQIAVDWEMVIH